jgi:hypothetical protein
MREPMKYIVVSAVLLVGTVGLAMMSCKQETTQPQPVEHVVQSTPVVSEPQPIQRHQPTVGEALANANSIADAMNICAPAMDDAEGTISNGAICLSSWGVKHFTWKLVSTPRDETTPGLVFKNSHSQLGKRICTVGSVVEITDQEGISFGEIHGFSGTIYHFITVGSSGSIVEHTTAHLCGFVVGTYSYHNSGGGTTHTVDLVGMWDLNYHPSEY